MGDRRRNGGRVFLTLDGYSTLTVSGTLTVSTSVTVDGGTLAMLAMAGGTLSAQSISSNNTGYLSGYGTIGGAVSGGVYVTAAGGALQVQGSLAGDRGNFTIDGGASLELSSGSAAPVIFDGGSATLKLDAPAAFTGAIEDVVVGDAIDLAGITASSASYNGSTLTINETNGQQLTYGVTGNLASYAVTAASDNKGGTLVYWGTAPAMTTQYWVAGAAGDWSDAADWVSGVVPGSTDNAVIAYTSGYVAPWVTVDGTAVAYSLTLDGYSTLTVSGTLTVSTSVTVDGGTLAMLAMAGGTLSAQSISSNNTGYLSGYGTIGGAVSGGVYVTAAGGALQVQGSLAGDRGNFTIDGDASLELSSGSAAPVIFDGGSATLKLDAPAAFTGAIEDVVVGDAIDLAGITASSASYNGSTLTINETNGQQLTYGVTGNLASYAVTAASDNKGGTLVYWTAGPTIAITTPIAGDNVVNKAEAAAGFAISGSETGADGRTVTVKIVNSSSQVIDTLTTTAASGAWSVNVTPAEALALADGSYTVKADVSNAAGTPATEATQAITVDETTPTVSVGINKTDLTLAHSTATVTFTFSEAPTAFSLSDVTTVGGTLSALTEVNATTYTATFTGAVNTDINDAVVSVTAGSWEEINGNPGAAGSSAVFTVNTMDHWIKSSSANWSTVADWRKAVPTAKVGADVDASGTYKVSISKAVAAYGLTVNDPGATVTDNAGGRLTLAGTGGSSSPNGVLNINAGTFDLNGGVLRAGLISIANGGELSVSVGAESGSGASKAIVDNGSITFSDVSPVIIGRSISGSGSIVVNEGSVTFDGAITGSEAVTVENTADAIFNTPIAGTGSFVARNGGSLEFEAADSEKVKFVAGATGTLKIDHSLTAPFTGTIAGLTKNDSVDLADLTWVKGHMHAIFSGSASGGVLTVSDGSSRVELDLSGNYTTSTWVLSKDSSGGTTVTDPAAGVSSGQTLTFRPAATDELIGSAYPFDGMVDDCFANGDAAIADAFAESARTLLHTQAGADGLTRTLTDGAHSAVLNLTGEPYAQSDFSIMSAHNGAGLAVKFV